jgi:eukaryotic-like serine/threonine-protein kinase
VVGATPLAGRYRLEERIAGGGMGSVYVATDELLKRKVAAKLLNEDLLDNPSFVERFRREARAVAALVHPNIAAIFDYGEDGGRPFIVMELAPGRDLAHVLRREGPLEPERTRRIAAQVCWALGDAHAAGVVHRDVKPANVIVSGDDRVKVTDFGIARAAGDTTMTAAGSVLGTPQYISPEQAADRPVGPPSDIYSAGVMLFEMLTGEVPLSGSSPVAVVMRHLSEDVPEPSSLRRGLPADLDRIVARATARDPQHRYADGAEMARALEGGGRGATAVMPAAVGAGLGAAGRSTDELEAAEWPPPPAARRGRLGPVLAVGVLLALLVAGVAAWALLTNRQPEPRGPGGGVTETREESPSPTPTEQQVTVPGGLVGSNIEEAEAVLRGAGLVARRENVQSEEEEGTVIAADPPEGAEVSEGDTVTLTVSTGDADEDESPPTEPPGHEGTPGPPDEPPGQENEENEG